jgi:hypothetical protein
MMIDHITIPWTQQQRCQANLFRHVKSAVKILLIFVDHEGVASASTNKEVKGT